MIKKPTTFAAAFKLMPACLMGAYDALGHTRIEDLRFIAEHEIDMFNEAQDGCLECYEIKLVKKFLEVI